MKTGDFNVLMIDWSVVAAGPCYPVVVANLNYVGTCAAQMLNSVLSVTKVAKDKAFHLIGFSMGAHVAAFTANHLRPYKLPRITGKSMIESILYTNKLYKNLKISQVYW